MDRIRIRGGKRLRGAVPISGAKNAALPLMAAALLTDKPLTLVNIPQLADISTMADLLAQLGVGIEMNGNAKNGGNTGRALTLSAGKIRSTVAPYDLVRKMRASVLVLGPLLAREGKAKVSLPGGCAIGNRPVDLHVKALQQMGAEIDLEGGYITARAKRRLKGAHIVFPFISVGATENLLMAASLASGCTVLDNAAREPEITDLAKCLVAMGAKIDGVGTERLTIEGVTKLHGTEHPIVADRIEIGTYAMAVGAAGGEVELIGADMALADSTFAKLVEAGLKVSATKLGREGGARPAAAQGRRCHDRAVPRLPHRPPGADDGADVDGFGRRDDHRNDLREPLHARARAVAHGRQHHRARRLGDGPRRQGADGGPGDGDRPAGVRLAGGRRAGGRRRNRRQPGVSSRPRLRAPRGEALVARGRHRATARLGPMLGARHGRQAEAPR
jgi:UDP-N-acetylglucosamine 1-carboxyvinyltransferase